ncbi:YIP1 family protein [Psychrobacillus sp.]|uniref:YIP1 family protein n=1 Tax=Psychrobacillus sp. TaxID=1871623 RepID=UPI0028BE346D|nr:YIP1 family protein [Psychrobacillus sp.]
MTSEMEYKEVKKVNPFFSIWLSPKETVRYVLDHKELKYSLILSIIGGFAGIPSAISSIYSFNLDISFWWILLAAVVLAPIFALIGLGIGTVIYTWVGKWFGGVGVYKEVAQAIGIIMIPSIWLTPYWILTAVMTYNMTTTFTLGAIVWSLLSSLFMIFFGIWMIVIQSKIFGEVHQFSSWRGFATLIIPSLIIGIIVFIFTFIFISSIIV